MTFTNEVISMCEHAFSVLKIKDLKFRPMRKIKPVKKGRSFVIGRTNLKTGLITIDILTPARRNPKNISSILRTLCHEVAHHQKPPYRQLFRFKWINRQHYPRFYKQVKKNTEKLKKDSILCSYFN